MLRIVCALLISVFLCVPSHLLWGAQERDCSADELEALLLDNVDLDGGFINTSHRIGNTLSTVTYVRTDRSLKDIRRERLYPPEYLALDFFKGKRVLDAGTGDGSFVFEMRKSGINIIGLDIHLSKEQLASPFFMQADLTNTGLPSNYFDVVVSTWSLLSYRNAESVMAAGLRELTRITKPGGMILISPIFHDSVAVVTRSAQKIGLRFVVNGMPALDRPPTDLRSVESGPVIFEKPRQKLPGER